MVSFCFNPSSFSSGSRGALTKYLVRQVTSGKFPGRPRHTRISSSLPGNRAVTQNTSSSELEIGPIACQSTGRLQTAVSGFISCYSFHAAFVYRVFESINFLALVAQTAAN